MAAHPSPAKIKAYIGKLKETVLDDNVDDDKNDLSNTAFGALLLMEIVQRGVLPPGQESPTIGRVLELVRSTAGKPLMDSSSSSLPKPLSAGMAAMGGMLAERCSDLIQKGGQDLFGTTTTDSEAWENVERRCKEVKDQRFLALVQIARMENTEDRSWTQRKRLLTVAQGCFLRATSFQPNPPQMWKRALTVVEKRHTLQSSSNTTTKGEEEEEEESHESFYPLQNLIRIAESKGNTKRVVELSPRLAESWLATPPPPTSSSSTSDNAYQAFVAPFQPPIETRLGLRASKAGEALVQCQNDSPDRVWIHQLQLRVATAQEEALIADVADEKHLAAKNRGATTSLETCQASARKQVLLQSLQQDQNDDVQEAAMGLCAELMTHLDDATTDRKRDKAMDLLKESILRSINRAQAVGVSILATKTIHTPADRVKAWKAVQDSIEPIHERLTALSEWNEADADDERHIGLANLLQKLPAATINMLQCSLTAQSAFLWHSPLPTPSESSLLFLQDALSACLQVVSTQMEQASKAAKDDVLTASLNALDSAKLDLEAAKAAVLGQRSLFFQQANHKIHLSATDNALAIREASSKYSAYQSKYGVSYLLCMGAWYGLHQTPWSYCNATQARALLKMAKATLTASRTEWGRQPSIVENNFLSLANADAEGSFLRGGLELLAAKLYTEVLEQCDSLTKESFKLLIKSHCNCGLAKLSLGGWKSEISTQGPEELAQRALKNTDAISGDDDHFYFPGKGSLNAAVLFHKSLARQLVADALIRDARPQDAESFLAAAVKDSPLDFDAAFGLGAFRLRMFFYPTKGNEAAASTEKATQMQLLKAAKLDSTKADPFALLGLWYEVKGDIKRAVGCFKKALNLDPAHPVAGRGIIRIQPSQEASRVCEEASRANSPLNGWAWRALGHQKAMMEGKDELAVICFQECLRCRDILSPHNESLSVFYSKPDGSASDLKEVGAVWADMAGCYRRLGRYTGALRAFESAWQSSGQSLTASVLCSWAQVELELGLYDDSAQRFGEALNLSDPACAAVAAYGQGRALLSLSQREIQDGKAGGGFQLVKKAIAAISESLLADSSNFRGAYKLLGDLHTLASVLPPDVFLDDVGVSETEGMQAKIAFVSQGQLAFEKACALGPTADTEELRQLTSALTCDVGVNQLLQAQLLSQIGGEERNDALTKFAESSNTFKRAIDLNPLSPLAWCGLGCAESVTEPLRAQHHFSRALQLDKLLPDAWANLGFLYATCNKPESSIAIMDALTQVADTPYMWICRALLLEKESIDRAGDRVGLREQAADAYRAALQVEKLPASLLGLSMTCRQNAGGSTQAAKDSQSLLLEYIGTTGASREGEERTLSYVLAAERGIERIGASGNLSPAELVGDGLGDLSRLAAEDGFGNDDVDDLRKCLKEIGGNMPKVTPVTADRVALQQRLVSDPTNGELWLELAKRVVREELSSSLKGDKRKRVVANAMESAKSAALKAAQILTHQTKAATHSTTPNARSVSESLVLAYCVDEACQDLLAAASEESVDERPKAYDVQRAMLMYPENKMARELLL